MIPAGCDPQTAPRSECYAKRRSGIERNLVGRVEAIDPAPKLCGDASGRARRDAERAGPPVVVTNPEIEATRNTAEVSAARRHDACDIRADKVAVDAGDDRPAVQGARDLRTHR